MSRWHTTTDAHGWVTHTRGACRIVVPPSGRVALYAPGCTSEHGNVEAAVSAAQRRPGRGW